MHFEIQTMHCDILPGVSTLGYPQGLVYVFDQYKQESRYTITGLFFYGPNWMRTLLCSHYRNKNIQTND